MSHLFSSAVYVAGLLYAPYPHYDAVTGIGSGPSVNRAGRLGRAQAVQLHLGLKYAERDGGRRSHDCRNRDREAMRAVKPGRVSPAIAETINAWLMAIKVRSVRRRDVLGLGLDMRRFEEKGVMQITDHALSSASLSKVLMLQ